VDKDLRALEQERRQLSQQRAAVVESEKKLRGREESVREREETFRRRLDTKLDDQLRDARRRIDEVIEELKNRAPRLVNTGETGAARSEARAAIDSIVGRVGLDTGATSSTTRREAAEAAGPIEIGTRVVVGGLDLEGTIVELRGNQAEIDVRGKRMRAKLKDCAPLGIAPPATVRVNVDLQPAKDRCQN